MRPGGAHFPDVPGDPSARAHAVINQVEERFCHNCGAPNPDEYTFCIRCGARINFLRPLPAASARPLGAYPFTFDVEYPQKLSRLSTLARLILAIPQLLIIYALSTVVGIVTLIAWFAILFTRRYPKGLFELVVSFNRWIANVYAYVALLRDEYPPFSTDPGRYPVTYEVDYPEKLSRWLIFVKWFLVLLHQFVLQFLGLFAFFAAVVAWFAILITGRFPRSFFNYIVGVMRWYLRVGAYTSLLRDEFPPFSKRADARPGSGRAVAVSVVGALIFVPVSIAGIVALSTIDAQTKEVAVSYEEVRAGFPTTVLDVDGNDVALLSAEDPYQYQGRSPQPRANHRFVQFELEIYNVNSIYTSVSRDTFLLKDSHGDEHDPVFVHGVVGSFVAEGEIEDVGVVFELRDMAGPAELTYSPGFAAFFPIGERVRFQFR
jgi:Domain of unknown function (DUF4389)/zinc-ribbon domain